MHELSEPEETCYGCGGKYEVVEYSVDTAINLWTGNSCDTEQIKLKCNKCGREFGRTVYNEPVMSSGSLEDYCRSLPCYVPSDEDDGEVAELAEKRRRMRIKHKTRNGRLL